MLRSRSLWPREHGAYAQIAAPLLGALVLGAPSVAAGCLAIAAVCAFLANEPLLVALGHRGARARDVDGARARRRVGLLGAVALASGLTGLALASPMTVRLAAVAAVPCTALLVLAWRRAQHSIGGELVAAIALPALAVPVAAASGVATADALIAWAGWALGYGASVLAVHRVLARHRAARSRVDTALAIGLSAAVIGAIALGATVAGMRLALVAVPLVAASAVLAAHPPRASRLRAIGVAFVVASVSSIVITLVVA